MSHTYGFNFPRHTYHVESLSDPFFGAIMFKSFTCPKENAKKHMRNHWNIIFQKSPPPPRKKQNNSILIHFWSSSNPEINRFFSGFPGICCNPSRHCWVESHAVNRWRPRFPMLLPNNPLHCMQPRHGNTLPGFELLLVSWLRSNVSGDGGWGQKFSPNSLKVRKCSN